MQRRTILATLGIATAGSYFGLTSQDQDKEQTEETTQDTNTNSNNTANTEENENSPDISADEANSTDEPPQERNETTPQEQDQDTNQSTPEESDNESASTDNTTTATPEGEPAEAIEFVEYDVVLDEAQDPDYESDELYAVGTIRNTTSHPVVDVRVEGYITVDGEEIVREYTEYARIDAYTDLHLRIDFPYDERAADGQFHLFVSAAEWA